MSLEAFDKYIGVQGVLAILLTVAIILWTSLAIDVPKEIWGLLGIAWGAYFTKNGSMIFSGIRDNYRKGKG